MEFNRETAKELLKAYREAVKENKESFMFHGHELLTSYAKYMIEYLMMIGMLVEGD